MILWWLAGIDPWIWDRIVVSVLIQGSSQNLICVPSLIFHFNPSWHCCQPWRIFDHIFDWQKVCDFLKYLLRRMMALIELGSLNILQAKLASKAEFFWLSFWIPNPLSSFGRVTVSHLTRCNFFRVEVVPQRKLRWYYSILFIMEEGNKMYCMIWLGNWFRVDLIRVVLLSKVRKLVF